MVDFEAAAVEAIKQLRAGRFQDADDLLQNTLTQYHAEKGLPPTPPPERSLDEIRFDLAQRICAILGNPPSLQSILEEYKTAVGI